MAKEFYRFFLCVFVCLFLSLCLTLFHSVTVWFDFIFRHRPAAAAAAHINVCAKPTAETLSSHKQIRLHLMHAEWFSTIINVVFVFLCVYSICHNLSFCEMWSRSICKPIATETTLSLARYHRLLPCSFQLLLVWFVCSLSVFFFSSWSLFFCHDNNNIFARNVVESESLRWKRNM